MEPQASDKALRIVFVHVPKCAGTSVDAALRSHISPSHYGRIHPIACRKAAQAVISAESPESFFDRYPRYQAFLLRYHLNVDLPFVSGHLPIQASILDDYSTSYSFVTVLRDPVDRWISHYLFNKMTFEDPIVPPSRTSTLSPAEELEDILSSWRGWQLGHMYTVFFSGSCPTIERTGEAVASACSNIERFLAVGFVDNMTQFSQQLEPLLHAPLTIPHTNALADVADDADLFETVRSLFDDTVRNRVHELCTDDYHVYNVARDRFLSS